MRKNEYIPTGSETYTSLTRVIETAQRGLRELGRIEGRNDLKSTEDLRYLVLDISKKIVESTPAFQLCRDDIDDAESHLCSVLNKASIEKEEMI